MKYKKKCIICGKEFETSIYNKISCSNKCSKIREKNKNKEWNIKNEKHVKEYNIEKYLKDKKNLTQEQKENKKKYYQKYYLKNKEKKKEQFKEYREKNKDKLKEYRNARREHYSKYNKEYNKKYREENRDKLIKKSVEYKRKKRLEDPEEKIRDKISGQIRHHIKSKKNFATFKILGYNKKDLVLYLESKFKEGMTWNNYGMHGWHIDHIKPVAAFKFLNEDGELDLEQIKECWSLNNLQPLWAKDNISKGSWYEVDGKMCRFSNGEIIEVREDLD